jgi:hypothetical protein
MKKSLGLFALAVFSLAACNVEHYDDCGDEDPFEFEDDFETGHRAGASSTAGSSTGNDAGSNSGGTTGGGGTEQPPEPPATPCDKERDCAPGFNCNFDVNECQATDAETCGELETEAECADRTDCIPVYGGVNCSCGADCECQGGEPGCICESFEYFVCRPVE